MNTITTTKTTQAAFEIAMEQLAAQQREIRTLRGQKDVTEARLDTASRDIQASYDPAYQSMNMRAPERVYGESAAAYEARLLKPLMHHSPKWAKADLAEMKSANLLPIVKEQVIADTMKAATKNEGPLRTVTSYDVSGRKIIRHYGAAGSVWNKFKLPYRFVKAFNGEKLF